MKELDSVVLTVPLDGIPKGTGGTIVHDYERRLFEVEFFGEDGRTIGVVLVHENDLVLA